MPKKSPSPQTIEVPLLKVNLNPLAFNKSANHYYKCTQDFKSPDKFSPVPYFLLCRSIELSIKARLLRQEGQLKVKKDFGHDLIKGYDALSQKEKVLTTKEYETLTIANNTYRGKGFEYFVPEDAMTGYKNYPNLKKLDKIAKKLLDKFSDN